MFKDITIKFSKNINCIAGQNGIGKSTILALLSNCGELKKKDGEHINGNPFRGELSQIILGDEKFDIPGNTYELFFSELPKTTDTSNPYVNSLEFRSTFQTNKVNISSFKKINSDENGDYYRKVTKEVNKKRFRLIPKSIPGVRETEKKLNWPVYYLGLSRLYPIGESEESESNSIPELLQEKINTIHKEILRSTDNYISSESISLSDAKNKKGIIISTDSYSSNANSSGQDNLGQIIATIISFEELKSKMGSNYSGGLFLIDEIDATLHPVAQNKLIEYLIDKSIELDLQIIFTTHSLSLLEYIIKIKDLNIYDNNNIQTIYLSRSSGLIEPIYNPSKVFLRNDLTLSFNHNRDKRIKVLTEDDHARWFLKKILSYNNINLELNYIESSIGWTNIIQLIKEDYNYFKNYLIILDPDVSQPDNKTTLKNFLTGTMYQYNSKSGNIFTLPGETSIEKMIWNYLSELDDDHEIFSLDNMKSIPLSKAFILNTGPFDYINYKGYSDDDKKIKQWFNDNLHIYINTAVEFWIKENMNLVGKFITKLCASYNNISKGF